MAFLNIVTSILATQILSCLKCEVVSSTSVSFSMRSCWPTVLLYGVERVLALSVDLPTVKMAYFQHALGPGESVPFAVISWMTFHWHWGVRRISWTWWELYLVFRDDLAGDKDKQRKSKCKVSCVGVSSLKILETNTEVLCTEKK